MNLSGGTESVYSAFQEKKLVLINWNFREVEQHKSDERQLLVSASWSAPVAGLLVGRGIDDAEHVPPDKRQEVFQRAEMLAGVAVMWPTKGGLKSHVLAIVKDPDEHRPVLPLRPVALAGVHRLFRCCWRTPPKFKHHPRCETWKWSLRQSKGTQQRGDGNVVSWGQAEDFLPPGTIHGSTLHLSGGLVEVGVHG